jgi:hypothetical protein
MHLRTRVSPYLTGQRASFSSPSNGGGGGSSLLQRLSSFLVGAGLTALATQYFLFQEIREGNDQMLAAQKRLEQRLLQLEKGK